MLYYHVLCNWHLHWCRYCFFVVVSLRPKCCKESFYISHFELGFPKYDHFASAIIFIKNKLAFQVVSKTAKWTECFSKKKKKKVSARASRLHHDTFDNFLFQAYIWNISIQIFASWRKKKVVWSVHSQRECLSTKTANRGGAPQASYDKRRHRKCFQTRPIASISKKIMSLEVRGQLMRSTSRTFLTTSICMLSVTDFDPKWTIL